MAVIIQRDNTSKHTDEYSTVSTNKQHLFDTIILYIVGFVGLIGSIYLLYLSNQAKTESIKPEAINTSIFIEEGTGDMTAPETYHMQPLPVNQTSRPVK